MSNRTGGERLSLPQTLFRMTFFSPSLLDTNAQSAGLSHLGAILSDRDTTILSDRVLVEPDGIEPTTSCLQSRRSPS